MHTTDLALFGVLVAVVAFLVVAYLSRVPYPILLVVGGAVLGFVPGVPTVTLRPEIVLVVLLPPLLYSAAFFSSLRDLQRNLRPISLLAIGCVLFTAAGVAAVTHLALGLSWSVAFTLGAILAPTDAAAATAIGRRVGAPRRLVTILEGESLVNDATALIAYGFAVAAVTAGTFSPAAAVGRFFLNATAGIAIGLAVGWAVAQLRRRVEDAPTESVVSLVTPYFAYLPAEALGVSAVLAAVTAGVYLGWRSPQLITPTTRLQVYAMWEVVQLALNAVLFTLVGLKLPQVLKAISTQPSGRLAADAALVAATTILVRFVWVFPATYLPRMPFRRVRERDPYPRPALPFLIGWTAMRGAVSLAAALALPRFAERDLLIFLVYTTILATLLGQGLSLPALIRRLGVTDDDSETHWESKARMLAAQSALQRIDELRGEPWVRNETADRVYGLYDYRRRRFAAGFEEDGSESTAIEERSADFQRLTREVLEAQRARVVGLRNDGRISDEITHRIERDLDLEDSRLEI